MSGYGSSTCWPPSAVASRFAAGDDGGRFWLRRGRYDLHACRDGRARWAGDRHRSECGAARAGTHFAQGAGKDEWDLPGGKRDVILVQEPTDNSITPFDLRGKDDGANHIDAVDLGLVPYPSIRTRTSILAR
jgi:hypothetical protein